MIVHEDEWWTVTVERMHLTWLHRWAQIAVVTLRVKVTSCAKGPTDMLGVVLVGPDGGHWLTVPDYGAPERHLVVMKSAAIEYMRDQP